VLEIGAGPGGLTAALAERAGRVVAIEKDHDLWRPSGGFPRWRSSRMRSSSTGPRRGNA
jgi:flavin-dependent dehydrogenase